LSSPAKSQLAWRGGDQRILWLANLRDEPTTIRIAEDVDSGRRLGVIDAASFERAVTGFDVVDALARPFLAKNCRWTLMGWRA
jgi:hypothetical protein